MDIWQTMIGNESCIAGDHCNGVRWVRKVRDGGEE